MSPLHRQCSKVHSNSCVVECMRLTRAIPIVLSHLLFVFVVGGVAQDSLAPKLAPPKPVCNNEIRSTYLLGPDDQLEISGPELTELANKPVPMTRTAAGHRLPPLVCLGRIAWQAMTGQRSG